MCLQILEIVVFLLEPERLRLSLRTGVVRRLRIAGPANAPGDLVFVRELRFFHVELIVPVGDVHRVAVVLEEANLRSPITPRMPAGRRTLMSSVTKKMPSGAYFTGVGVGVGVGFGVGVGGGVGLGVGVGFGLGVGVGVGGVGGGGGGAFSHEQTSAIANAPAVSRRTALRRKKSGPGAGWRSWRRKPGSLGGNFGIRRAI